MKGILYATRAIAEKDIDNRFDNYTLRPITTDETNMDFDDSMAEIGSVSGYFDGYDIEDENGNLLGYVAWYEEGGEYKIRVNGEVVKTATYWGQARSMIKELAEKEEEKAWADDTYVSAEIDCITDDGDIISMEEVNGLIS